MATSHVGQSKPAPRNSSRPPQRWPTPSPLAAGGLSVSLNTSRPASTITSGSKKYPREVGRARPLSGAHKEQPQLHAKQSGTEQQQSPQPPIPTAPGDDGQHLARLAAIDKQKSGEGRVATMRQPKICSPASGARKGAEVVRSPIKRSQPAEARTSARHLVTNPLPMKPTTGATRALCWILPPYYTAGL